ncbi:MAG: helix-turn-helix transcriptional regulator [Ruminococcaceae bacterium]|nr:helix-turn-helix transcriptional regulator [Oscillospiraceae bacterium]
MAFEFVPIQQEISISGFHSLYYFEFDKHFYHPPEKHDFWELVYVDYGSINAIVDGVGCTLKKGQVIFHEPMEAHCHIADQQNAANVVVVAFACDSPMMSFFHKKIFSLEKAPHKILTLFLQEATNALGKLCGDYENKSPLDFSCAKPGAVQLMQCYLVEFLFSLIRSDEASVKALRQTPATRQIAENSLADSMIQYIHSAVHQMPSLAVLCKEFSISRTYLCRIFKEAAGTSPVEYWIAQKMKEAKKLLREDNHNITQISMILGYASIHHFTRTFKRFTGMSPTDYKNSVNE